MEDRDINKILVSKKASYGKESTKYYIGYNDDDDDDDDDDVIGKLCIKLPQMVVYVKHFKNNNNEDSKRMSFKVSDKKLLKNYSKMWKRVSNLMNIEFDSEPVYGDNVKYIWARMNLYGDKIYTNFQGKKKSQKKINHKSLCH